MKEDFDVNSLTEEEKIVWAYPALSEYWRIRNVMAFRALKKQEPVTLEEMRAQYVRINMDGIVLSPEEQVIWNNIELTEHERALLILSPRNEKKRAEFLLRKQKEWKEEDEAEGK